MMQEDTLAAMVPIGATQAPTPVFAVASQVGYAS